MPPPVPSDQQPKAPPPRGPHDRDTRPHSRTKHRSAAQRDDQSGEAASPYQRQGDRGSGDDGEPPLQRWIRYADLKRAGIVIIGRNCSG